MQFFVIFANLTSTPKNLTVNFFRPTNYFGLNIVKFCTRIFFLKPITGKNWHFILFMNHTFLLFGTLYWIWVTLSGCVSVELLIGLNFLNQSSPKPPTTPNLLVEHIQTSTREFLPPHWNKLEWMVTEGIWFGETSGFNIHFIGLIFYRFCWYRTNLYFIPREIGHTIKFLHIFVLLGIWHTFRVDTVLLWWNFGNFLDILRNSWTKENFKSWLTWG